eukprot:TRINITY_DN105156_c0_g1_i1.p1 TRINITY_DN105156_c0_g1~~TRINITY_DN105156_c0_g1_i1.p1  ORF type:complete len:1100 (+),score=45.85 TRINITY_DN105156_c0_g1_i1:99-3302(+)
MGSKATKAQVRKSLDDLLQSNDEPQQRAMWKTFIEGKVPMDLVLSTFTSSDIEFLLKHNYSLYRTLLLDVLFFCQILQQTIEYLSAFASTLDTGLFTPEATSVSICVKLLQKMLPPLLSLPQVAHYILWLNGKPKGNTEEDVFKEITENPPVAEEQKDDTDIKTPYGARLMQCLINLLFKQNFCIANLAEDEKTNLEPFGIDIKTVWSGGLQFDYTRQHKERVFDANRCDVLYTILMCIGSKIYEKMDTKYNLFSAYATNGKTQNVKNFFFSLLNTVVSYDWKGYGIPYMSAKAGNYDNLADLSLQLLCVLVEYTPMILEDAEELVKKDVAAKGIIRHLEGFWKEDVPAKVFTLNEFSRLLSRVEGQPNYSALFNGIARLLSNFVTSKNSALPNSVKELKCFNEIIIFFLRLVTFNPVCYISSNLHLALRRICNAQGRFEETLTTSPLHVQQMHCRPQSNPIDFYYHLHLTLILIWYLVLQKIIEAEFGTYLATPFSEEITFDLPLFQGSYGDLLILLLHRGLQTGYLIGSSLQQSFLSILYNVSPFLRNLTIQSVMAIFQLIAFYSSPKWLLKDSESFVPLKLVLDSVFNILTYNFESNSLLVFALLNQSKKYLKLADWKFSDLQGETVGEWKPTEEWFNDHKAQLPLKPILGLLANVSAKMEQAYLVHEAREDEILALLKKTSLVGMQEDILKFSFLRYTTNPAIESWLSIYLWKIIHLKNSHIPLFISNRIRYFNEDRESSIVENPNKNYEREEIKEIKKEEEKQTVEEVKGEEAKEEPPTNNPQQLINQLNNLPHLSILSLFIHSRIFSHIIFIHFIALSLIAIKTIPQPKRIHLLQLQSVVILKLSIIWQVLQSPLYEYAYCFHYIFFESFVFANPSGQFFHVVVLVNFEEFYPSFCVQVQKQNQRPTFGFFPVAQFISISTSILCSIYSHTIRTFQLTNFATTFSAYLLYQLASCMLLSILTSFLSSKLIIYSANLQISIKVYPCFYCNYTFCSSIRTTSAFFALQLNFLLYNALSCSILVGYRFKILMQNFLRSKSASISFLIDRGGTLTFLYFNSGFTV